jgi:hypothetical protein
MIHDQPVALGEVAGHELPAVLPEQRRPARVEQQRERPQRALQGAVGERGGDEQADAEARAAGKAPDCASQVGEVGAGDDEQHDVGDADHAVGAGEQQGGLVECPRHAQRDDEQPRHRGEHDEPHDALLGLDDAGQPGVAHPCPPQRAEHEHALGHAGPGRLVGHQRRALGDGEHEDEVEEQLQRRDPLLLAQHRAHAMGGGGSDGGHVVIFSGRPGRPGAWESRRYSNSSRQLNRGA